MAVSNYTGVTTQDQNAAANTQATAAANASVMSTQQMPQMTSTAQPGIIASAMAAPDYTSQITDLYRKDLGRAPDADGLAYWTKIANGGESFDNIDRNMRNSDEYKNAHMPRPTSYTPALLGTPEKWNVTSDQTAQGQMAKMIDPNNPYYQQWAAAGAADAAARGFTGNSSLRQTGILDSVMRNATPIATNDAGTYAKAAGYNTDQVNQFSVKNQEATNSAGQFNANIAANANNAQLSSDTTKYTADKSADTTKYTADKSSETSKYGADTTAATQKYLADQSAATQLAVSKLSNASQQTISQLHDANSVLLQNNQTAQAAYSAYVNAVANIDIQPSMDEKAKRTAIETQTNIFNSAIAGLKAASPAMPGVTSPLDVSPFFEATSPLIAGATIPLHVARAVKAAVDQVGGVDVTQQLQNWS